MTSYFRKLPLPLKFIFIGVFPFAFMVYLTLQVYSDQTERLDLVKSLLLRIRQTSNINDLINELELERKYSDYALKNENSINLLPQRSYTDMAIKKLQDSPDLLLSDFKSYTFLDDLSKERHMIDTSRKQQESVMYYYTNIIYRLNTLNAIPGGAVSYIRPAYKDMVAQKLVSEMATFLGIITTNVYNLLYSRKDVYNTLMETRSIYDVYKSYEREFYVKADPSLIAAYDSIRKTEHLAIAINYIDTLFQTFRLDSSRSASVWDYTSSSGLQHLKAFQKNIWQTVQVKINEIYNHEKASRNRTVVFLAVALLFIIGVVLYTLKVITTMLNELKDAANKISKGHTGIEFHNVPNDVIGSLAKSISDIDDNNRILSKAANAIGKGDFNVSIQPRNNNDLLGNSILQMKKNLEYSTKENEELMRKKDEFMSVASHELKTPITSVKGALQIVERFTLNDEHMKAVQPFVQQANRQVNKLTAIINDLLDITKIQSGQLKLFISEFTARELLDECYEQVRFSLNGHSIIMKGDLDKKISADKYRMEQVMNNLISNALKYSPGKSEVLIEVEHQADSIKISVTDYGIGIAKEKIPYIFGRFFRVEETSQSFSGLGLGLYISSEIVRRHQGNIGVTSEAGIGTTFWLNIPLHLG
ncbi:MAG: ATP-binding protein [Ginsengibacter sp.]